MPWLMPRPTARPVMEPGAAVPGGAQGPAGVINGAVRALLTWPPRCYSSRWPPATALPRPPGEPAHTPPGPGSCRWPWRRSGARSSGQARRQPGQAAAWYAPAKGERHDLIPGRDWHPGGIQGNAVVAARADSPVPGRDQQQGGIQGYEQRAVGGDGLPLQRDMSAVLGFRQVFQADPGQPGQPSRRARRLHQAGDGLPVGRFGSPQQHPVPGQDLQPGPGGTEAGIEQDPVADDDA